MRYTHDAIANQLRQLFDEVGITYTMYEDTDRRYPLIDGLSIKLWNFFPLSGTRVDIAVSQAEDFLRPLGLMLSLHVMKQPTTYLMPVGIPQHGHSDISMRANVTTFQYTHSWVVKPRP